MVDFGDEELSLGQRVAYTIYGKSRLYEGSIVKFTKVMVAIKKECGDGIIYRYPNDVLTIYK